MGNFLVGLIVGWLLARTRHRPVRHGYQPEKPQKGPRRGV